MCKVVSCSRRFSGCLSFCSNASHYIKRTSPLNNLNSLINYVALPLTHEDLLGEFVEDIVAKYNSVHFAGAQQVIQTSVYVLYCV